MAKATQLWSGNASNGTSIEVAQSESGVWFFRDYTYNGYGKQWSKWKSHTPNWDDTQTNHYTRKVTKVEPYITWGFTRLYKVEGPHRNRLPK